MLEDRSFVGVDVAEMSISEMLSGLDAGSFTSVDLVCSYLNRVAYYDRTGICLNSVPLINPEVLLEAKASDSRRQSGCPTGPLEGVPFTVKDSYMVKGLPVASGSPALADLVATKDAATVEQLRGAGAVVLGKTNMPPMAAGGVQPGLYGYSHSPYSPTYLTAAYGSGSSHGSGTATSASFAGFGMAEETLSSGRSPASNNALVAYTPSRGLLSIRGNWPLRPTCDVVVPHTRTVEDLLRVVDVVMAPDPDVRGDFWRSQTAVDIPDTDDVRPLSLLETGPQRLDGVRLGVPRVYLGEEPLHSDPPVFRESVRALWQRAIDDLTALGAEIVPVDLRAMVSCEDNLSGEEGLAAQGYVSAEWEKAEGGLLTAMALEEFLQTNADPTLGTWADVDGTAVFPNPPEHTYTTKGRHVYDWQRLAEFVKSGLPSSYRLIPGGDESLKGLERARKELFESRLAQQGLDSVIFPANGDVARADLFERPESMEHAHRNGVVYSNGNRAIRHLGIPTVTVPMGWMSDTKMPVGITFAGCAYADTALLRIAFAYEQGSHRRTAPYRTPSLPSGQMPPSRRPASPTSSMFLRLRTRAELARVPAGWMLRFEVAGIELRDGGLMSQEDVAERFELGVWADGMILQQSTAGDTMFTGMVFASRERLDSAVHVVVRARHRDTQEVLGEYKVQPLPHL